MGARGGQVIPNNPIDRRQGLVNALQGRMGGGGGMGGGHGMGWWSRYQLEADDAADRRNGYYQRHLLTELGDIELNVPRTRRYSPVEVIRVYARRTPEIAG